MVKIPCDHMHCFRVFMLLPTEHLVDVAKGRASVSIRWYVHSSYQDNGKLTGKVNWPASDRDELQVSGAVPIGGGRVCAPPVVHVNTQSSSPGLTGVAAPVVPVWSFISSILFARDLTLERKTLGSDGQFGRFRSWTTTPARHPRFCFLSLRRLLLLLTGMSAHGESGVRANSGDFASRLNSSANTDLFALPPLDSRSDSLGCALVHWPAAYLVALLVPAAGFLLDVLLLTCLSALPRSSPDISQY
ncbi:hypothetical protein GOODEAATRI_020484 [Goodea atripinnis]|uniref:Uncharacterized protein n=1 Tax=Goodea atripinnis TaxID=208336 RepID=A0ABV0PQ88_9TELE